MKSILTSTCIVKHIQRAYYQTYVWLHPTSRESVYLDPHDYGYILDDNENLIPDIGAVELPENFSIPCTCMKCARENICPCKAKLILCCQYCKCNIHSTCKNLYNLHCFMFSTQVIVTDICLSYLLTKVFS